MLNISRYRLRASSCPDIYRNSMTTIAEDKDEVSVFILVDFFPFFFSPIISLLLFFFYFQWYAGLLDLWYAVADMMDFSFFTNISFLLFAISNFLLYTWYDVPYVYLADFAVERGFSVTNSTYIISIIGILNMLGEVNMG